MILRLLLHTLLRLVDYVVALLRGLHVYARLRLVDLLFTVVLQLDYGPFLPGYVSRLLICGLHRTFARRWLRLRYYGYVDAPRTLHTHLHCYPRLILFCLRLHYGLITRYPFTHVYVVWFDLNLIVTVTVVAILLR